MQTGQTLTIIDSHQPHAELIVEINASRPQWHDAVLLELYPLHGNARAGNYYPLSPQDQNSPPPGIQWLDHNRCKISFEDLPHKIRKLAFTLTLTDPGGTVNFNDLKSLSITIRNAEGSPLLLYELDQRHPQERQLILGHLYSYRETWRFRAIGQGFRKKHDALKPFYHVTNEEQKSAEEIKESDQQSHVSDTETPPVSLSQIIGDLSDLVLVFMAVIGLFIGSFLPWSNLASQGELTLFEYNPFLGFAILGSGLAVFYLERRFIWLSLPLILWTTLSLFFLWQEQQAVLATLAQDIVNIPQAKLTFLAHNQITLEWSGFFILFCLLITTIWSYKNDWQDWNERANSVG
ncbi:TerD family protein [Magnetococcales bacterium HHB-1]